MMFRRRRRAAVSSSTITTSPSEAPLRHLRDSKFMALIFPHRTGGRAASATVLAEYITCLKPKLPRSPPRETEQASIFFVGVWPLESGTAQNEQARVRRDS